MSSLFLSKHRDYPLRSLLLVMALLVSLSGCGTLAKFGIGTTAIGEVVSNPRKFPDVTVRGKVTNQFTLLGKGAYEVKDDTGSLWIFTQIGAPAMGTQVAVRGSASEGANIAGQNLGVTITEQERY